MSHPLSMSSRILPSLVPNPDLSDPTESHKKILPCQYATLKVDAASPLTEPNYQFSPAT
jgi:hypothetical protein